MATLRIQAHAKLNLGLRVVGRRTDGYHLLQSTMAAIDLADTLSLSRQSTGVTVICRPDIGLPPEKNLVYKAVRSLLTRAGSSAGVKVLVDKRIPSGAGLGGGSTDAAAALLGTDSLLNLSLTQTDLAEIALDLGSDVPFFLGPSPAWVEGVGEQLRPSPAVLPRAFLLLLPPRGCPTAQVYRRYDELGLPHSAPTAPPVHPDYYNDLYAAAVEIYPELSRYLSLLERVQTLGTGMTGSGSGLFAAFSGRPAAQAALRKLQAMTETKLAVAVPVSQGYKISR